MTITQKASILDGLAGKVDVTLADGAYGFVEDLDKGWLVTNNQGKGSSTAKMTMTAKRSGMLTFQYKVGSEARYDKFTLTKGSDTLIDSVSGTIDWTQQQVLLAEGDTLTFTYTKDYSGDGNGDSVWIKDLAMAPAYTITLQTVPENAAVVLKDSSNKEVSGNKGKYTVVDGTYTYAASAFGYEEKTGTITVDGADVTETVQLTALPRQEVTFDVTLPEGLDADKTAVEVKSGDTVIEAEESGKYSLPAGDYSYTVSHPNCDQQTGTFTVADQAQQISVELVRKLVFSDFFDGVDGITATDDDSYPFTPVKDEDNGNYLKSSNIRSGYSSTTSAIRLEVTKPVELSFKYLANLYVPSYSYSTNNYLIVKNGSEEILAVKDQKVADWTDFTAKAAAGDVITIEYKCYSYAASADQYNVQFKDFQTRPVHKLTFTGYEPGSQIVLKQGDEVITRTGEDYYLTDGTYDYEISKLGYSTATGSVTINGEDVTEAVSMEMTERHTVTFNVTTNDGASIEPQIKVMHEEEEMPASADGSYSLADAAYTYVVSAEGYDSREGAFGVDGENKTVSVELNRTLTVDDFISSELASASNDKNYPYKGVYSDEGNYLQSTNNGNYQFASITIEFSADASLAFDYWTRVGTSTSYGMTISNGSTKLEQINGENDWTGYRTDVSAGDTITIKYSRQYNEDTSNCIRLKNFVITPLYAVNFDLPEGAKVEVFKDGAPVTAKAAGQYKLPSGSYDYTVSQFGYEDKTGTVTVEGAEQTITVAQSDMTALETAKIRFAADPEDAQVTVTHADAGTMTADEDGGYQLPQGETFSYKVEKANYIPQDGTFTVTGDATIEVKMVWAGEAWDGETKTQPEKGTGTAEDPYIIASGENLAWLCDQVNSGSADLSASLSDNINLNGKSWAGIGTYSSQYAGTLDGQGHTISGLSGSVGLVSRMAAGGTVKDLTVIGQVSGDMNVGGIVSYCYGTVENCLYGGTVENSNSYSTGGIVGALQKGGRIIGCVNTADITNTFANYASDIYTGGIAGYSYGEIRNCYSTGDVTTDTSRTNKCIGGFAGRIYADGTVKNCYSTGTVSGPQAGTYNFAGDVRGTITNCYVLDTAGANATAGVEQMTAGQMAADDFVVSLNAFAFNKDAEGINAGFPVLKWQGGTEVDDPDLEKVAAAREALKLQAQKDDDVIDLTAEGDLYNIKPGQIDKLLLPAAGEEETAITWTAEPAGWIDTEAGTVTAPESGKQAAELTARITKGNAEGTKTFKLSLWSEQEAEKETLAQMAAKLQDTAMTASQIAHPEEGNVSDVVKRTLEKAGFDTEGLNVTFAGVDGDNKYIAENGDITYYKGETSGLNYAVYNRSIKVKLSRDGVETDPFILKQILISWDKAYVQGLLDDWNASLTWDSIKGDLENEAEVSATEDGTVYTVSGNVKGELKLPANIGSAEVTWSVVEGGQCAEIGKVDFDSDYNRFYPVTITGIESADTAVKLQATLTYNKLNDEDKAEGVDPVTADSIYVLNVARDDNPGIDKEAAQKALDEQYDGMITDFVNKEKAIDTSAVTDDIQMPTPSDLEKTDIMQDRDNEKVEMTSSNEDVLSFYGYHGYIYRPLPGEEDAVVTYTVSIINRTNGSTVATAEKTLTVKAFTQEELDAAAAEMKEVATSDVYLAGLLEGTANTQDGVTENLNTYKEIWKTEDGYKYVKGKDADFSFIALDELPGYDPMGSQKWWTLRSSNTNVITDENLLVTRPEEKDVEVTIDSVMSYVKYANYWAKFGAGEGATEESKARYAAFEQFYKQPVSATLTVTGVHIHTMVHYEAREATETEDGNIEYWLCTGCGKYFTDEAGTNEVSQADVVIPKTGTDEPAPAAVGTKLKAAAGTFTVTSADPAAPAVALTRGAAKAAVSVPATITADGVKYTVTEIAPKAFYKNKKLKKVTVGSNIRTIGAQAFSKCSKLKSVTIGKNVKKIGAKNFAGSKKLKVLTVKSTKLTKKGVKNSLKGSRIKTVKVKVGAKKLNKKYVKKYKKYFTKKNCGRKVKVK